MAKPIGAREGHEIDIGERTHEIARRGLKKPDDETDLRTWIERCDGDLTEAKVEVKEGEPDEIKWLVVPSLDAIEKGIARLPPPGDTYELRAEYAAQTFPENLHYLKDLAGDMEDEAKRDVVREFLDGVAAPPRKHPEEFFYFRLGEYCVTQCY